MPVMKWAREGDSYYLRNPDGMLILRTKKPAVLYDKRNGRMHRCGDFERVERYAAKMRADYIRIGDVDSAMDLVLLSSAQFSVEELNRCIGEPGYCLTMHKRISTQ